MVKLNKFLLSLLAVMLCVGFVSCGDDDDDAPGTEPTEDVVAKQQLTLTFTTNADTQKWVTIKATVYDKQTQKSATVSLDSDLKSSVALPVTDAFPAEYTVVFEAVTASDFQPVEGVNYDLQLSKAYHIDLLSESGKVLNWKAGVSSVVGLSSLNHDKMMEVVTHYFPRTYNVTVDKNGDVVFTRVTE